MLNKYLSWLKDNTSKEEFKEVLNIATVDIKFNRVSFNKCTSPKEFILICNRSLNMLRRTA